MRAERFFALKIKITRDDENVIPRYNNAAWCDVYDCVFAKNDPHTYSE